MENKRQADGFVRIAAATPPVRVADCPYNTEEMYRMIAEAAENGAAVLRMTAHAVEQIGAEAVDNSEIPQPPPEEQATPQT